MLLKTDFKVEYKNFNIQCKINIDPIGIIAISGPSGSGKTTILKAIAGLQDCAGYIKFGHQIWKDTETGISRPPYQRHAAFVFQDFRLFPHLTCEDNILFAARLNKQNNHKFTLNQLIEIFDISKLLHRMPATLSGGEQQRIAIVRAVISQPELLLLDEPLVSVDESAKAPILTCLRTLNSDGLPMIYVSHNKREIEGISDRVFTIQNGKLQTAPSNHSETMRKDIVRFLKSTQSI